MGLPGGQYEFKFLGKNETTSWYDLVCPLGRFRVIHHWDSTFDYTPHYNEELKHFISKTLAGLEAGVFCVNDLSFFKDYDDSDLY